MLPPDLVGARRVRGPRPVNAGTAVPRRRASRAVDWKAKEVPSCVTAPTPVATLQPMMAAYVQGRSWRIGTSCSAGQTTYSEKVPMRAMTLTGSPLSFTRELPSCMRQRGVSLWPMQSTVRPCEQ